MLSKNLIEFQKLYNLPYFTGEDVANLLGIQRTSASVFCSRYAKRGLLVKLKNNFYITSQKLKDVSIDELFSIANVLQVPSYVSLMTGLAYYEITTQVQRYFIESASLKRSIEYEPEGVKFKYYKLNKAFYSDFVKINNLFIATKEKCFLDAVYLYSFGKYNIDFSSLNLKKLDMNRLEKLLKNYPVKTKKLVRKLCRI
jgi:predicted transcriptional regulator of viral defense system